MCGPNFLRFRVSRDSGMRVLTLAVTAIGVLSCVAPASAEPGPSALAYPPPFIDHAEWTQWNQAADEAWAELLALAPNAGTPGMRQQFQCHWELAEVVEPGKVSWNLEPWRPVVDDPTMVGSGCNPGGGREPF